jgi:hypothetical protein
MQLNKHIYNYDEAKIAFVMSFLNDKEAEKWKETYRTAIITDEGEIKYPTFKEFITTFTTYFQPINQALVANNQIVTIRQGKRTVEEYLAEFRLLSSLAGMTADTPADNLHLINYFKRGLNPFIARKIALSEHVPTTIVDWADRAVRYDTNYRLENANKQGYKNTGSFWNNGGNNNSRSNNNNGNRRDPYAMDVDAMTTEERTSLMKQGKCFKCKQPGHLARDCKGKATTPQKKNIRDIHALLQSLTPDETKELMGLQDQKPDEENKEKKGF